MALPVLDGNQSATTLSSVVIGGEHIVAHSVVSLGSNAISNIATAISGSTVCVGNLGLLQSTVATEGLSASGSFIKIGGHTGTSTTGHIVHVSAVGALRVDGSAYTQPISIASVTIGSLPAISGTVTVGNSVTVGSISAAVLPRWEDDNQGGNQRTVKQSTPFPVRIYGEASSTSVTFGATITNSVTIGSLPAISGTVTANVIGTKSFVDGNAVTVSGFLGVGGWDTTGSQYAPLPLTDGGTGLLVGYDSNSGNPFSISGTVTANNPSGALTTRFGSVTTANTAQITSAVTNTSRKYLLAQNISAGTVTIGIGFSPTTTQGIQLTAGGGLTFDAFCPTGAIFWLGAVTGAAFTILEG